MARLTQIGSFIVITGLVLGGLRALHVVIPAVYPEAESGPIKVDTLDQVQAFAGFSPRVPYYRPIVLGSEPADITVQRRPHPRAVITWRHRNYLVIAEQVGGPRPVAASEAVPMRGRRSSAWWEGDGVQHLILESEGHWLELTTDLPYRELRRIAETLRPLDRAL